MVDEQKLRKRAKDATPGPWTFTRHTCGLNGEHDARDDWTVYGAGGEAVCMEGSSPALKDPEWIAAANPAAILSLLDELKTLREERTAWRVTAENAEAAVKQARIDALDLAMEMCRNMVAPNLASNNMTSAFKTPSHERGVLNGAVQELRRLDAENEARRKWIEEAIQPLGLYQAYGWRDRMGVIARGRKLLENPHG